jgi:hypothetical protein
MSRGNIMTIKRNPWVFAVLYMAVSMAMEIVLIVIVGLRVPRDNKVIAPILLTFAPMLAALIGGYRRPKVFAINVVLTAALTLGITLAANALTGIHTGMVEPIITRSLAGLLGAAITNHLASRMQPVRNGGEGAL